MSQRSKIRAVLADDSHARRETVMLSVLSSKMFDLVAIAVTPEQSAQVIEETVPEVVLCPERFVDTTADEDCHFPLYVLIGQGEAEGKRIVARIKDGTDGESTHRALAIAATEVVTLKAHDLSNLIAHYVQFSESDSVDEMLDVEVNGNRLQLSIHEVYWIEAARNYVAVHARSGVFDAREPISRLASRLQKLGFMRVHRGAVVNSAMISRSITQSGVVVGLRLSDGTQIPVGPSFRESSSQWKGLGFIE